MILLSEAGESVKQIVQDLNTYPNKVIFWRQRYVEKGLTGLQDKPSSGRPPIYDETFRNNVLELLSKPPPKGLASWDDPALAKELDVPVDAIWKILRKEGINIQRHQYR